MTEHRHSVNVSFDVLSRVLVIFDEETKGKRQFLQARMDLQTLQSQMRTGGIKDLNPRCPICESNLSIRAGRFGDFLVCPKSTTLNQHGTFSSNNGKPYGQGAVGDALTYQIKTSKKYMDADHVMRLVRGDAQPTHPELPDYPDDYFDGPDRETIESQSCLPWE